MYSALIVAAGSGIRSGLPYNKVLYPIKDKPLIIYSVDRFLGDPDCEEIIVVAPEGELARFRSLLGKNAQIVSGGKTRQESVMAGLTNCHGQWVLIHDGARPNIRQDSIEKLKKTMLQKGATTLAVLVKDTLKACEDQKIAGDINRENTYSIQTPQAFLRIEILEAHRLALLHRHHYSDDTSVYWHELGKPVWVVEGTEDNLKATTKIDLMILEALL